MYLSFAEEKRRHKKKRLVQSPNSYFMDVKCMGKAGSLQTGWELKTSFFDFAFDRWAGTPETTLFVYEQ